MFLVYVFDGLRPELVTADLMPNLWEQRRRGTWFERSHCVFPSVTRVNAASLATGSYPSVHGIPSNTLYLPASNGESPFRTTGDVTVLRSLRTCEDESLLGAPTIAEMLALSGLSTLAVGTGSPGSAYLLNPEAARIGGGVFHYGFSEPAALRDAVETRLGSHAGTGPEHTVENLVQRVRFATTATTDLLVPHLRPDLLYFWSTIPDALHHEFGLGSAEALDGLLRADQCFGDLVTELIHLSDGNLNIIVTADHGYSTVERHIAVAGELQRAGFNASGENGLAVHVDGGAAHFFWREATRSQLALLVEFLAEQAWAGALFAREPVPGALPLSAMDVNCARAADVIACFSWRHGENVHGFDGFSPGGGGIAVGNGDHGGGSPFEMRNTLLASGPAFRAGAATLPAGIVDIAPTVCRVFGVAPSPLWSGRVLGEALFAEGPAEAVVSSRELCSLPTARGAVTRVVTAEVAGARYVDVAFR